MAVSEYRTHTHTHTEESAPIKQAYYSEECVRRTSESNSRLTQFFPHTHSHSLLLLFTPRVICVQLSAGGSGGGSSGREEEEEIENNQNRNAMSKCVFDMDATVHH